MSVVLSYYLSDGVNVPTETQEEEFDNFNQIAKFCVLMGGIAGNQEVLPIAIDKANRICEDVDLAFIEKYYQG